MPATREQIYAALQAADKAGNTNDARALAQMYAATAPAAPPSVAPVATPPTKDQLQQAEDLKNLRLTLGMGGQNDTGLVGSAGAGASSFVHGLTFGADDLLNSVLTAGTQGVGNALKSGNIGDIGQSFSNAQAAAHQFRSDLAANHPVATPIGGVAGAIAAPLGPVEGLLAKGGEAAVKASPTIAAIAAKLGESGAAKMLASPLVSPVIRGAQSGATYGALTGATGSAGDPNFVGNVANSTVGGAIGGGIGGGIIGTGAGVVGKIIADKAEQNASNVAYSLIADTLKGQKNPDTGAAYTPQEIADQMQAARDAGNAPMVGDTTRNLRGMTAELAKRGDTAGGDITDAIAARDEAAPARISQGVNTALGIAPTEPTAFGLQTKLGQDLANVRNDPTTGYDAVLKATPVWNQQLEDTFSRGSQTLQSALRTAVRNASDDPNADAYQMVPLLKKAGVDPGSVGLTEPGPAGTASPSPGTLTDPRSVSSTLPQATPPTPPTPPPTTQSVPSVYALDQVRRALKDISDANFKGGDTTLATNAKNLRDEIATGIIQDHPAYGDLMQAQRNLQDRTASVQQGQNFIQAMQNGNAEPWLAEAQATKVSKPDLVVGIGDALRNSADPVGILQNMIKNPAQKNALTWAIGDPAKLDNFTQFIKNEVQAAITSKAAGGTIPTGTLASPSETDAPLSYIGREAARGLPFGIPSGVLRAMNAVKSLSVLGPNAGVRNQLASILTSGGQALPAGADAAAAYRAGQLAARLNRAGLAGRGLPALVNTGR